jgi:FkbM family methyltransferase
MINTVKSFVPSFLKKAMRNIIPPKKYQSESGENLKTEYELLMLGLLSALGSLRIVQVGANDGATNDPIYNFVMEHKLVTEILLIEPQTSILPYLEHNYSSHHNKMIYNGAIGANKELTLYSMKEEYWPLCSPPYAKEWPSYRAPSGITSSREELVVAWAKEHLPAELIADEDSIVKYTVPCTRLRELLDGLHFISKVDVLQIDAEGCDDEVVYCSSVDYFRPRLINYESKYLSPEHNHKLHAYLFDLGYKIVAYKTDTLLLLLP